MKRVYVILFFLSLFFLSGIRDNQVAAHGVNYTIDKTEAMIIRVEYDDGEPMRYAEVKIFAPDDQKLEYQNGRTDKLGRFAFYPTKEGEWKITVSDGMGHGITAKVSHAYNNKADIKMAAQSAGFKKWQKIIMALSVAWGFIGLAFFFQARIMRRQ